jgi:hypothetical protein
VRVAANQLLEKVRELGDAEDERADDGRNKDKAATPGGLKAVQKPDEICQWKTSTRLRR